MNKIRHILASLLLVGLMVISSVSVTYAATDVGGMDLYTYCQVHHKWGAPQTAVLVAPFNAYAWRCRDWTGGLNSIHVNHVCAWQYGHGAWASTSNWEDPYSWRCYK
ncbi:MAG: hypothetical protein GFH27_549281n135 [Chloroflexi bacterium AL-W]|nr:hypothetical protein [Chloroflexi bacterium AL-N1]NOK66021.1 hypothetical protein [Chloroflexi bacterium AL-N10]NOK72902.1 hypothetical protein [Chloroflexi bacterium AL-N5]NOK79799.1 hypothetical protein [Chloroflexi bacterium AL-W]NOK88345.1 hypothetical protein [Chloroflexi bacterium AL-N15]